VDQGLRGGGSVAVFEGLCRRLGEAGVPLWRGFAGVQTLHPRWGGYSLTWQREENRVVPERRARGAQYDRDLQASPFALAHMARQTGFAAQNLVDISARYGNQIAASIPFALDIARRQGRVMQGTKVLFLGTSAGVSFGGMALEA